jgi:hypothetical protein
MKKIVKIALILVALLCVMFLEYRYIMCNIKPYRGEEGTVYLEVFGQVDEYYAEEWEENTMYHIDLVDSYGYEFYSILGEFETIEDAIRCIEQHIDDDLEKLDDMHYLDGHDLYTIYKR